MGTGSVIVPGDVQRMSAGKGVLHSEMNASRESPVHFLQIWILPDRRGHDAGYEQRSFPEVEKRGRLRLVASPDGAAGSVSLHQDALLWAGCFQGSEEARYALPEGRAAWVHVARGALRVNGERLGAGDAAALGGGTIALTEGEDAEVLLFDLSSR